MLAQDFLRRAPAQSNVLRYLLERSCDSNENATQYDLAIEALGKPDSFDETTDSSVRVQIGRLRHSMEEYYRLNQPANEHYAYIPSHEYKIKLAKLKQAYPGIHAERQNQAAITKAAPAQPEPPAILEPVHASRTNAVRWPSILNRPALAVTVIAAAFAVIVGFNALRPNAPTDDIGAMVAPKVSSSISVAGDESFRQRLSSFQSLVEVNAKSVLRKSMISRAAPPDAGDSDYDIQISVTERNDGALQTLITLQNRNADLLLEREIVSRDLDDTRDRISDVLGAIVSPAGVISHDLAERIHDEPQNDFECFIATETYRSNGMTGKAGLLRSCIERYKDGPYYPYLESRRLFENVQAKIMRGDKITPESAEWLETSRLLEDYPDNAYANTLAAKLLIGDGECAQAEMFAADAFARGRTYPALELALIVDAYDCAGVGRYQRYWDTRIARITKASPSPHPLLESYMLLGLVASDQLELLQTLKPLSFATAKSNPLENFNRALRRILQGQPKAGDQQMIKGLMPTLIWNEQTRRTLENRIFAERS